MPEHHNFVLVIDQCTGFRTSLACGKRDIFEPLHTENNPHGTHVGKTGAHESDNRPLCVTLWLS